MVNIAEKRKAQKMTQAELAQLVSVSQRAIAAYELGERRPSVTTAKKLGKVLGFSWVKLFEEDDDDE